jgi:hypothetical protein
MTDKLQQFSFKEDLILERFDENALLVDLDTEKVYQLNATGARIAELIIEKRSVSEIITALNGEYEAALLEKETDVLAFLQDLLAHGLIAEKPIPNGNRG